MHDKRQPKILDSFSLPKAKFLLQKEVHLFFIYYYKWFIFFIELFLLEFFLEIFSLDVCIMVEMFYF